MTASIPCPFDCDPSQTHVVLGISPYQIETTSEPGIRTETVGTVRSYGGPTLEDCARRGEAEIPQFAQAIADAAARRMDEAYQSKLREWLELKWSKALVPALEAECARLRTENADLRRERDALMKAAVEERRANR